MLRQAVRDNLITPVSVNELLAGLRIDPDTLHATSLIGILRVAIETPLDLKLELNDFSTGHRLSRGCRISWVVAQRHKKGEEPPTFKMQELPLSRTVGDHSLCTSLDGRPWCGRNLAHYFIWEGCFLQQLDKAWPRSGTNNVDRTGLVLGVTDHSHCRTKLIKDIIRCHPSLSVSEDDRWHLLTSDCIHCTLSLHCGRISSSGAPGACSLGNGGRAGARLPRRGDDRDDVRHHVPEQGVHVWIQRLDAEPLTDRLAPLGVVPGRSGA